MIQVWIYNEQKIFVESKLVDEVVECMTQIPLLVGYIKPTFNEELQEWYEGATPEEIQKWEDENTVIIQPTLKQKVNVLEGQVADLEIELLKNS